MDVKTTTLAVLVLTFLVICWYSWETRGLKKETRELRKWQKLQAQLSVIHMEMNRKITEYSNGPEKSPGYTLNKLYDAQKRIIQEEDVDFNDIL